MTTKPFNQLTPAKAERLALLAEECGEVVQIIGKILRRGYESFHPDNPDMTNRQLLEKEIGDVMAAADLMVNAGDVDDDEFLRHARIKQARVRNYLHHQSDPT